MDDKKVDPKSVIDFAEWVQRVKGKKTGVSKDEQAEMLLTPPQAVDLGSVRENQGEFESAVGQLAFLVQQVADTALWGTVVIALWTDPDNAKDLARYYANQLGEVFTNSLTRRFEEILATPLGPDNEENRMELINSAYGMLLPAVRANYIEQLGFLNAASGGGKFSQEVLANELEALDAAEAAYDAKIEELTGKGA